jgi:CHAD domain-containing protein
MAHHSASDPREGRSDQDPRELEWQLAATDLGAVRRWLLEHSSVDGLVIEPTSTQHLHDTYLDTDDWRIHRAGFALRIRQNGSEDEATLKSLRSQRTDAADRRELNEPLPHPGGPETLASATGQVGARVQAVIGEYPLRPLFEIRTTRQRFTVRAQDDTAELGEIALDETVVARPKGEPQANLTRVEVEAKTDRPELLEKLVKTLRAECALSPSAENKFALGLRSVGLAPSSGPQFTPATVEPNMTAAEAGLANLRRLVSEWFRFEPGARLEDDPEQLHDLRVTARRMYATIKLFSEHLPEEITRSEECLKGILNALGAARDLDLQVCAMADHGAGMSDQERLQLEPLLQHLQGERSRARAHMLRTLDSAETRQWLETLTDALTTSTSSPSQAGTGITTVAPDLIRECFRKLRKTVKELKAASSMEELHDVRMRAKKLRHAIESVAVIYGKPAEEILRALRRLQDRLGVQQDAHVAKNRLLGLATDPPKEFSSETVFLMGRLAERESASIASGRKRIDKAWRRVRGRRWKALRAKLEELRPKVPEAPVQESDPAAPVVVEEIEAAVEGTTGPVGSDSDA